MKKLHLLLTTLFLAAAAGAQPKPELIARIHFAGADRISADTNYLAFTNEFCSAEARALESQTLDKFSRAPGVWFKSKIPAGAGDGAAQLRPLLDDLLKSEWVFEARDTAAGSPEYALAIRLGGERAQLWSKNLAAVLQSWTGVGILQDKTGGWVLRKHDPPDLFQFSRAGDWVVIDCGQDKLSLGGEMPQNAVADNVWLSIAANWPRLSQLFPALKEFDFPKIQMQVIGRGGNLLFNGGFTLAQPLPPLENWRLPSDAIRQPLISFTAARGVGPWLAKQPSMRPLVIQPQPDQHFIWALAPIPFRTYAAEPVPDAKATLVQLNQRLSADTSWQKQFIGPLTLAMTNNEIFLRGMPYMTPIIQAVHGPAGDFLIGGLFPNVGKASPLPPKLLAHLNQPNLVYYHLENTAERLKELPQMSQLVLVLTRHWQLDEKSTAAKWINRIRPALGNSETEVTQVAPNELLFQRVSPGGLTAMELFAFADWLEAPHFPALDMRLPPQRVRPMQKPVTQPSKPPAAFTPPHP